MHILYIGQYTPGTTSKMRADQLRHILKPKTYDLIDTHIPFHGCHRFWRSLGFRYKRGPLINKVNSYVVKKVNSILGQGGNRSTSDSLNTLSNAPSTHRSNNLKAYDLIWIDKAIFLTPKTTGYLKSLTSKLIHFTPDMAFYSNKSKLYESCMAYYDYHITTKTAEIKEYKKRGVSRQLITATQGFDKTIHKPTHLFNEKDNCVAFIGLCEPNREGIIKLLIENGIKVKLAGKGWRTFVEKNKENALLTFIGDGLFSDEYTNFLSSTMFSIGLLSKKFAELHTTRTFEIPACGTALITERNSETESFFKDDEAIFYASPEEMISQIKHYQSHPEQLKQLTQKGMERVQNDGRDYESILRQVLSKIY